MQNAMIDGEPPVLRGYFVKTRAKLEIVRAEIHGEVNRVKSVVSRERGSRKMQLAFQRKPNFLRPDVIYRC